jgi:hypothetical protein
MGVGNSKTNGEISLTEHIIVASEEWCIAIGSVAGTGGLYLQNGM